MLPSIILLINSHVVMLIDGQVFGGIPLSIPDRGTDAIMTDREF